MLDRPPLTDAAITAALGERYGIETSTLEFLALGHDANAWTFRGRGGPRGEVFVKIRRAIDPARLAAERFLALAPTALELRRPRKRFAPTMREARDRLERQ
jgi:hypothetical protein